MNYNSSNLVYNNYMFIRMFPLFYPIHTHINS